jgi:hypothetical protein
LEFGIRNPASFPDAQKGCPLRQNHRDPAFDTAAQDAATVSMQAFLIIIKFYIQAFPSPI